jgi:hypothetical protein
LVKHFHRNIRLRWVFRICSELGIDDPVHWMNSVSPLLVDQWIAYHTQKHEQDEAEKLSPEEALKALSNGR